MHTYNITGMTCDGCRTKVEKTLNAIDGVEAKVSLNPPIATITMEKHIPVVQFQEALTAVGKYTIDLNNGKTPQQVIPNEAIPKSCCSTNSHNDNIEIQKPSSANGKYYCPMHCEAKKSMTKQATVLYAEWI